VNKPPKIKKQQMQLREWNDGFSAANQEIPKYQVAEDRHAQGYIAGLQK